MFAISVDYLRSTSDSETNELKNYDIVLEAHHEERQHKTGNQKTLCVLYVENHLTPI